MTGPVSQFQEGDYVQARDRVMGRVLDWVDGQVRVRILANPLRLPAFTEGAVRRFDAAALTLAWPDREKT